MTKELRRRYNDMSMPVKAGFWFMICNIIPQVVTVVMTTIFTRILSTNDYGISSNYAAWYSIISIFLTLNLNCGVYNNAMMKYEHDRDGYTSASLGLSLLFGSAGLVILLAFSNAFESIMKLPYSLIVCLGVQCLLYNSYGCWVSRTRYEYKYKKLIILTAIVSIASPLFAVIGILLCDDKAVGKVLGQNCIYIFLGILFYILAFSKSRKLYDKEYWKFALIFNLPLLPHYLSLIVLNQSDRVMITSICGASDNGLYSVAYSAASLLLILNGGITQAMTPWIYSQIKKGNIKTIKQYGNIILILYVVIDIVFTMLAPEAIAILAGKKYADSVYVIPPVAASMYFIFLYNIYSIVEFYYERTKPVMICSTLSAGLNIALNYYFIPRYGYIAAAYTTLVCYVFNSFLHVIVLKRLYRIETKSQEIISLNLSMIIGLVIVVVGVASSFLYSKVTLRWGIIIMLLLFAFLYRKTIIDVVKKMKSTEKK